MELKRSPRRCMTLTMLFFLGSVSTSSASESKADLHLDCYTVCERMFCSFKPQSEQSCDDFSLKLSTSFARPKNEKEKDCVLQKCNTELCCCSAGIEFIFLETYNATLKNRGKIVDLKEIDVTSSLTPKPPTITSVNESNGNFEVRWRTNMENCPISAQYSAEVTYCKKDTQVTDCSKPAKAEGNRDYYQIPAGDLEPSTTYVVSLRSVVNLSGRFSDRSEEWEFSTAASPHSLRIVVIISLCFAAVIITAAAFGCYAKFKAKWKNSIAKCPVPVILETHLLEQELLKPTEDSVCLISIDPLVKKDSQSSLETPSVDPSSTSQQQTRGVGARSLSSSSVDVEAKIQTAIWGKLGHLLPAASVTTSQPTGPNPDSRFTLDFSTINSTINFVNFTYSSLAGSKQSASQETTVDSAYLCHQSKTCDRHAPACLVSTEQQVILPEVASSLVTTDLSYQMYSVDSGRLSHPQGSSLSSISCVTNTTTSCSPVSSVEASCESSDTGVMKLNDKNVDGSCYREPCIDHKGQFMLPYIQK